MEVGSITARRKDDRRTEGPQPNRSEYCRHREGHCWHRQSGPHEELESGDQVLLIGSEDQLQAAKTPYRSKPGG